MSSLLKEVLREMITWGNLRTSGNLHSYLKDMFKNVPQVLLSYKKYS